MIQSLAQSIMRLLIGVSGAGLNHKADVPNLVTYLYQTPIFEWYVVRCGSKNRYQNDLCLKEIGLHAQNMVTILGSTVNIIGGWGGGEVYITFQ